MASALIAGTKRKLQHFLGSGRARSESNASSPKKRKVHIGNSATTKVKNSDAVTKAARDRAEVDAAEHSRQIASREDRAMKRSSALTISKRSRPTVLRHTAKGVKSTRHTTVSLQRKVVRPGALKAVNKSSRMQAALRRTSAAANSKRGLAPLKRPSTPSSSSDAAESSDEDTSPNITPASLRSASKDGKKRIFNFESDSQATPPQAKARRNEAMRATSVDKPRSTRQKLVSTPRRSLEIGSGTKQPFHAAQSRPRTMRGR